jgi:hypothetical protein
MPIASMSQLEKYAFCYCNGAAPSGLPVRTPPARSSVESRFSSPPVFVAVKFAATETTASLMY